MAADSDSAASGESASPQKAPQTTEEKGDSKFLGALKVS